MLFNQMFRNIAPHQSSPPSFLTPNQPTFNPVTPEPVDGPANPIDYGMQQPGYGVDPGTPGGGEPGGLFKDFFGPQMGFGMPAQGYDQQPQQTPNADAVLGSLGPLFGQMFGQGQLTSGPVNPDQQDDYSPYYDPNHEGTGNNVYINDGT